MIFLDLLGVPLVSVGTQLDGTRTAVQGTGASAPPLSHVFSLADPGLAAALGT